MAVIHRNLNLRKKRVVQPNALVMPNFSVVNPKSNDAFGEPVVKTIPTGIDY
jgi:hypothetical protein